MKTKKRFFLLAFSALIFGSVYTANAQVTIGSEIAPTKGATLDLSPSSGYVGGLKLPNVSLENLTSIPNSFTDFSAITPAQLKGLQVYNTNSTLGEGVYTWNGERWSGSNSTYIAKVGYVAVTGDELFPTTTKYPFTFSVPVTGTYKVIVYNRIDVPINTVSDYRAYIVDGNEDILTSYYKTLIAPANGDATSDVSITWVVNLVKDEVYRLRIMNKSANPFKLYYGGIDIIGIVQ